MEERALSLLESTFDEFIKGSIGQGKLCKNIATALSSLPFQTGRKKFTVELTKNTTPQDFFGMRIFPSIEENMNICGDLIRSNDIKYTTAPIKYGDLLKRWKKLEKWNLEIDSMLFERDVLAFTPKELVALTLHELGHVIYSDKPIEKFYRAYKENQLNIKIADRGTQKAMYMIYMIPLTLACAQRRWVNGKNEIHVEIVADGTVVDYGYGDALLSALDKIVHYFGSINNTAENQQAEINTAFMWCNRNIQDVNKRKTTLKDELYYYGARTKSNYLKAVTVFVMDKVGFNLHENYNGIATEATVAMFEDPDFLKKNKIKLDIVREAKMDRLIETYNMENEQSRREIEVATEALMNKRKKVKAILPSQFEVDAIAVEVDRIENHSDRIYVLDLIYNLLERINIFEEAISPDPMLVRKWQDKVDMMKDELNMYRRATLEKKTFNKSNYHLFVKLPPQAADYEG